MQGLVAEEISIFVSYLDDDIYLWVAFCILSRQQRVAL